MLWLKHRVRVPVGSTSLPTWPDTLQVTFVVFNPISRDHWHLSLISDFSINIVAALGKLITTVPPGETCARPPGLRVEVESGPP